ncbi:MAG: hypothetical protein QOF51_1729 [Chloroflexota bacterium]|jgi:hypothetical protein|nr:hypothetical protein [Chloroflexota bacterium]
MPTSNRTHSIPTLAVILTGIVVFALGLVASLRAAPPTRVHAQDDTGASCTQPSDQGCPIDYNTPVQAALNDSATTHNWLIAVPPGVDLNVTLTDLSGNYELLVYGPEPDFPLLGQSDNPDLQDETIAATNVGTGTYWITIDSPSGDASDAPYTLLVQPVMQTPALVGTPEPVPTAGPTPAPFKVYGTPVARPILPY